MSAKRKSGIQGGVWAFFAVWSVGIYSCTFDYPYFNNEKNTVGNLFYYSYELGSCRYDTPSTSPELGPPNRTYSIMLTYGILSAVWIPSSILLLVAAVNKLDGKFGARCYYPWLLITVALLVLDIVATIIYIMDIVHSMTTNDYKNTFPYVTQSQVRGLEGLTVIPSVVMVVFFCRAIFIWLINIVIFGVVIQTVRGIKRRAPTSEFVEKEARMKPTEGGAGSSWVAVRHRPMREPEVELSPWRPPLRREETIWREVVQSPSEERNQPSFTRPTSLPLQQPSNAPPPPPPSNASSPWFDVTGKPTTPDSPQPVFLRSNTSAQLAEQGVDKDRPWSYVNPRQVPLPGPPRPLPEPDYTMHRGGHRRPNLISPSENDENRPSKRYENNPNVWKVM